MKIGIIGCHGHQNFVFNALDQRKDLEVVAIASGDSSENMEGIQKRLEEKGHSPKRYDHYLEMLDHASLELVSSGSIFGLNGSINKAILERKIALFAEKPIACEMDELVEIEKIYQRDKTPITAMMNGRYEPAFYTAYQLVQSNAIGQVCMMISQKSYKLGQRPVFYQDRKTYGGSIPWVGSHAIDRLHWYCGKKALLVKANHFTNHNEGQGDLETYAAGQVIFEGDVIGVFHLDYFRPSAAKTHGDDRIRVIGTKGYIEVRQGKCFLTNGEEEGEVPLKSPPLDVFLDFVASIENKTRGLISPQDVFDVTRSCLRARESADIGSEKECL